MRRVAQRSRRRIPSRQPAAAFCLPQVFGGIPVAAGWTTNLAGATISGSTMTVPANTGTSSRPVVAFIGRARVMQRPSAPISARKPPVGRQHHAGAAAADVRRQPGHHRALQMNGTLPSRGISANTIAIASLTVPTDASHQHMAIYEYGTPPTSRRAWRQDRCDMSATATPNFLATRARCSRSASAMTYAVNMQPGETYLMIRNQKPFARSVVLPQRRCDIGIKWYPPN